MGFSQDFLEKATLLVLTGGLSGFIIPYVLKQIDERKLREQKNIDARKLQEQKEFDANLIRQNNIIEAQIKLLETLSKALWELQLLALAVSYYKVHPNQERYEVALKEYDDKSWQLFRDVRCEISKAARLAPDEIYQNLLIFFSKQLIQKLDEKLMSLIENKASLEEWEAYYKWLRDDLPEKIDNVVTPLAKELKLTSSTSTV
jgi:hypothetical protein